MNANDNQDGVELRLKLARLEIEHQDYDHAIEALRNQSADPIRVQRFKKKKLALKDEITKLHAQLLPDIIA